MSSTVPIRYDIELDIDPTEDTFTGEEKIEIDLEEKTDEIVLNATDMNIESCELLHGGEERDCRHHLHEEQEQLIIQTKEEMDGRAAVVLGFTGKITNRLAGLYRSRYEVGGETRFLATTQMEPADCRRVIPCFDRPDMKARFNVTLTIPAELTAISNMPAEEEREEGMKKRVRFETTPRMSSYLLYLGVGEFEFLEDELNDIEMRVAATPGKVERGGFSLNLATETLDYYQDYFDTEYPLPKLDNIAVPDFAAGAMENWGAIAYRESQFLYDEEESPIDRKYAAATTVTHELAHMWFGNLVTMEWWNDLWLNESFATWLAHKYLGKRYPESDFWSQFMESQTLRSMDLDSLNNSHPIEVGVDSPGELSEIFDAISYGKGASVLRMIENYLGEEGFRRGLRRYIEEHAYGNAVASDLWNALGTATDEPVEDVMDDWIGQEGYPLIDAGIEGETLKISQKRFLFEGDEGRVWKIPIVLDVDGEERTVLMEEEEMEVELGEEPEYVKLNPGETGFYRVRYQEELLNKLREKIDEMEPLDRLGIENDLYALSRAGEIPFDEYLNILDAYEGEDHHLVVRDIASNLYTVYLISSGELKEKTAERLREFCRTQLDRLGWDDELEGERDILTRSKVITYLGMLGDDGVLSEAHERFENFKDSPESLDPDLKKPVFSLTAWDGDEDTYQQMMEMYRRAETAEERVRFLIGMGGFGDEALIRSALDFSLTTDVRPGDVHVIPTVSASNPVGREIVWNWIRDNWDTLEERYGRGGGIKLLTHFIRTLSVLASKEREEEIREFFRDRNVEGIERTLEQALEKIRINHRFLEENDGL